jgi:ParB family transcriptional regulator, chromosome partitioning protein
VRATEEYVRRLNEAALVSREADSDTPKKDAQTAALEDDFRRALGTKVELSRSTRGGRVVIFFYSDEELEGIYSTIVRA